MSENGDPPEEPPAHLWLVHLLFRPRRFFRAYAVASVPYLTAFACYLFGIAIAIDRLEQQMMRQEFGGRTAVLAGDWTTYWIAIIVAGGIGSLLLFTLGGWWYRMRLQFCGAVRPDIRLTRRVYIFASLVYAIPTIVYSVWETTFYDSPIEAWNGDDPFAMYCLIFVFWSAVTSYKGATTAFQLRVWPARLWFLILPSLIYAAILVGFVLTLAAGWLSARPDLTNYKLAVDDRFRLHYPGNWILERQDADAFSIEPPYADCTIYFTIGEPYASIQEAVEDYRSYYEAEVGITGWRPLQTWGPHTASGVTGLGPISGSGKYRIRLVVMQGQDGILVIQEICDGSALEAMESGLDFISRSFQWLH